MASDLMVIEVGPIPDQVKLRIFGSTVLTDWHSKCTTRCDQSLVLQDEWSEDVEGLAPKLKASKSFFFYWRYRDIVNFVSH